MTGKNPLTSLSRHDPPTAATIDLSAIGHNLQQVRQSIRSDCEILAVVKADAYGHGAIPIAHHLQKLGITRFGVATLDEGLALRTSGISGSILVMGGLMPHEWPEAMAHALTPILFSPDHLAHVLAQIPQPATPYPVHLKLDTGMGRLGFSLKDMRALIGQSDWKQFFTIEGFMSHLADSDGQDIAYTQIQIETFEQARQALQSQGLAVLHHHLANSAAILRHPSSHFTMVRPGIMLYGYHSLSTLPSPITLRPALTLKTRVLQIRTLVAGQSVSYNRTFIAQHRSKIAVLPIGYADGVNRLHSNRGAVLLSGKRAPIVGRVCMDMMMVDVSDIPDAKPGDEAILIGRQGKACITALDLAQSIGTIPYEILCSVSARVPRRYQPENAITER